MNFNKNQWPNDLRGYSLGKTCRLIGFLENSYGGKYFEFDVARDVSISFTTDAVDTNCWRSADMKEYIAARHEMSVDADLLFDIFDPASVDLLGRALYRDYFRIGAFTDSGFGPWFWTFATEINRSEELEGIVHISVKFPCARFIYWYDTCFGYGADGLPNSVVADHPLTLGGFVSAPTVKEVSRTSGNPTKAYSY